jgi:hypothetical protein
MTDHSAPSTQHEEDTSVGFEALIEKVRQAETALEAKERETVGRYAHTRATFRAFWTPGRIVVAGLLSGFVVGRSEPFKRAAGGGTLQLISALGSLFAGSGAKAAAEEANDAAHAAEAASGAPGAVAQARVRAGTAAAAPAAPEAPRYDDPDTLRGSGRL